MNYTYVCVVRFYNKIYWNYWALKYKKKKIKFYRHARGFTQKFHTITHKFTQNVINFTFIIQLFSRACGGERQQKRRKSDISISIYIYIHTYQ